ncbi:MAG: Tyrocidine synthase 3 [Luteibacter sp.]|uniref:non-ribosomal peptide synthetase n=1 Tax=Luteibacter sp. TaxID=1886636 RepID=UPI001382C4C3|nr:non-ribosomal peptide synthase/polyketide synthase [Luteibacter sp.]KAF1006889.1 MAG: Tyrocidine synthase 3 [Luteibacter sp.]
MNTQDHIANEIPTSWNGNDIEFPADRCIHELFEREVDRAPEATALRLGGELLTYAELDARANRLAWRLRDVGVGPDVRVAICMPSRIERVIAVLATWKAGGAYVPLDPGYPVDRLAYLLHDSSPAVMLTDGDVPHGVRDALRQVANETTAILDIDDEMSSHGLSDQRLARDTTGVAPEHMAYVIYTSGSTGQPKGVMVEHRGVCNLATMQREVFAVDASSRVLQCASFSFDACLFEMVMALCNGASLHLPPSGAMVASATLAGLLLDEGITHATLTPSVLSGVDAVPSSLPLLRVLAVAGEACPSALVDRWAPGRTFINAYGPTETTVWATWHACVPGTDQRPPIGRPVGNTTVYVLDAHGKPAAPGASGELYIGGVGVARGYLGRDALTRERFVPDVFSDRAGATLYRTGDLVRWLDDGTLDFLGRVDDQVKLRGLRIEPGEVEARLADVSGVRECAVVLREDTPGDARLVAYVIGDGTVAIEPRALRHALSGVLPEYMVPSAYVTLDALPLTPNGKLDRKALPVPGANAVTRRPYVAPVGELETAIATIWNELLRTGDVGRDDHFFELGGHSLLAVQVSSRLRQRMGLDVPMSGVFSHPVLRDFANAAGQSEPVDSSPFVPGHRPDALPLSFAQQRLWFIARTGDEASKAYNLALALRLGGSLNSTALSSALARIVQRHEALRTCFGMVDGHPVQRIQNASAEVLSFHTGDADIVARWRRIDADAAFDLANGPMFRARLIRVAEEEHVLLLTMHHIVSDGWSMGVLAHELDTLYRAYGSDGMPDDIDPLPSLNVQYADYALWQRHRFDAPAQASQIEFWRGELASVPELVDLPSDRPRPARQDYRGRRVDIAFDGELTSALRSLSQRHGATLYMTLLAAWGAVVSWLSGQDEVVIGSPVANRTRTEVEPLIGFFVNTLALRVDVADRPTVAQLIAQVRDRVLRAQAHQDLPFEQLVEALRPRRTLAHTPIFQIAFAWQNRATFALGGLQVEALPELADQARFDLTLDLAEEGGRIVGSMIYATSLYDEETVRRHLGYLEATLRGMVRDDTLEIDSIALISDTEQAALATLAGIDRPYPCDEPVYRLVERQAALTPDTVAVEQDGHALTYRMLDDEADALAWLLKANGVGPEERVALCLRRGPDLVRAMLAVSKAGGAYVPLDPAHPVDRLRDTLVDCAPRVVLTHADLAEDGRFDGWAVLRVEDDMPSLPAIALQAAAPSNLAYVIYTSGSTGRPNGVMVEHRQLANLIGWHGEAFPLSPGERTSCTAGVAFDACTWEIWPALCHGATLVLPPLATVGDPSALLDWWEGEDLRTSFLVTALADAALSRGQASKTGLRQLLTGGDRLGRLPSAELPFELINNYGPTETTVVATSGVLRTDDGLVHIGRPIANTRIHLLDRHGRPVPMGAPGEIHVAGAQVARGYLNRPELTAARFLPDPFAIEAGARMYRTGDLGRWLPDGRLAYLGRNDHQVKIRGLRIEPGEIEARLLAIEGVREATVLAREDVPGERRLVAYVVPTEGVTLEASSLRDALAAVLPGYMVPVAYVTLSALPLTANGKVDRRGLPAPDDAAYAQRVYEAPEGEVEIALARLWSELLGVERVGRRDNFFELGGHSLLAVQLVERMRSQGLHADIAALFAQPTLAALAQAVSGDHAVDALPTSGPIPPGSTVIVPDMLSLVALDQPTIDRIVATVPGGTENVQDIYPLAPLQEGILFHHLMHPDDDPYLLSITLGFATRNELDAFVDALRHVVARHDVLRTAMRWEGLDAPLQLVWREARLDVTEVDGAIDPREAGLDLRQAPLVKGFVASDTVTGRWSLQLVHHHLVLDHTALDVLLREIAMIRAGRADALGEPVPFRRFVAWSRHGVDIAAQEGFFRSMLGDVDEPTAPFGLLDVHGDGRDTDQARRTLSTALAVRLRAQARRLGVSVASLFHWAWAQVLAKTTGRDDVVFGTVLFGRLHAGDGADRAMGLFINTLPIRIGLGEVGVRDGVVRTQATLSGLVRHEHASLALAQRCSAIPGGTPLFSSLLNYRHSAEGHDTDWTHGHDVVSTHERTSYPIDLSVDDHGEGFNLSAQAVVAVGAARVCAYMEQALVALADALDIDPSRPSWHVDILDDAARSQVLAMGRGDAMMAADGLIHALFEEQARRTPQAVALEHAGRHLTYEELNARANRLARHLRDQGVGPDDRVALCVERGMDAIVAILATLKAGGAYVPLDPSYPDDRLAHIVRDSEPRVVLTLEAMDRVTRIAPHVPRIDLDAAEPAWQALAAHDVPASDVGLHAGHLAYVIYTSGSTGVPKGVAVEHGALRRRIEGLSACYGFHASDRILQFASINFDASVEEICGALTQGAALVLRTPEWLVAADAFWTLCEGAGISVVDLPTKFWQQLVSDSTATVPEGVRAVIVGGEAIDPVTVGRWMAMSGHRPRLFNTYGPTEAIVVATVQEVVDRADVQIGRPVAETSIYVLDAHGGPVAPGVAGEIHIGGATLARGYIGRPELTQERFVDDPFASHRGGRMYRTGDLGRWSADGRLEYMGRNDQQVKIRGFRVEPAEIEATLRGLSLVRDAAVLALPDATGGTQLVAYVVAVSGEALDPSGLRAALSAVFPEYMLPAAYVALDRLPLTPGGKLDRRALPVPSGDAFVRRAYEAPRGDTEVALAHLWSEVLQVERVGRTDHFFELGGHSLLAVRLMERMRRASMHADIRTLFARPTLAALAEAVDEARREGWQGVVVPPARIPVGTQDITPAMLPLVDLDQAQIDRIVASVPGGSSNVQDIYPLAPLQEGILFHHLLQRHGDPYLLSTLLSFASRDRLDAFVDALQAVIDRHDVLRTAVLWDGLPEPVQVVWRNARLEIETPDLPSDDRVAALKAHTDPRDHRLDITRVPLMRAVVAHDRQTDRWLLSLLQHHLAMDHVTGDLILEEIGQILDGDEAMLAAPLPFRDFVAQARLGASIQEHESFFQAMLGDVDEPTAPFGLLDVHGDGEDVRESSLRMPSSLCLRLRRQARVLGVSAASLFHWAWAQVLAKTTGREDVVFGTVLFGRLQGGEGADRAMGLFINTLPVRVALGEIGVADGVRATHARLSGLVRHEHAPLAVAQRCSALPSGTPLFSALLNYRHSVDEQGTSPAWMRGAELMSVEERTNYPITLSVDDLGDGFALSAQVVEAVDADRLCVYMLNALTGLADALEHSPSLPSRDIGILGEEERRQVLHGWNDTRHTWNDQGQCIHQLFERQARRTPDATALEYEAQRLSYRELNERANRLAHELRARGVGPEERVALCLWRSIDMVVAIFAVLKAGGGYVPLDPSYPADRIAYMLGDCQPRVVLAQAGMDIDALSATADVLLLDGKHRPWDDRPIDDPVDIGLHDGHLAYVIYTSGSTGQPKGVMIEHAGVVNRMAWMQEAYGLDASDAVLQKTPFGFDVSVWEFFWPLTEGARLVMARPEGHKDPVYLAETIREYGITTAHFVPSLLQVFIDGDEAAACTGLRRVVCSGEALPGAVARRFRQVLPGTALHNLYGPTEATVDVTAWTCDVTPLPDNIPIGAPIANTSIYVLDAQDRPVPAGVPGEIHIGGVQVARGYLNRPELTRERFVPDPYAERAGARMYRTGDLGRWLPDGTVEYLGRNDHQVKIRGLRIELGEIEAGIGRQPGVQAVAVLVREDVPGDKRLVAYVVPTPESRPEASVLRQAIGRDLPDYMVPSAWVFLDALPLTPNGKLDRSALPTPEGGASIQRGYTEPVGPTETLLAGLWAELLRVEQVGRDDHFFELGGHSLLAVRMMSRLRQRTGRDVGLPSLFAHPVLRDFAVAVDIADAVDGPALVPVERSGTSPLSFAQRRLWLAAQLGEEASAAYHMPIGLRLRGRLDEAALEATLRRIRHRHDVLRTSFVLDGDEPVQRIAPPGDFVLRREALEAPEADREAIIHQHGLAEAKAPFDLATGPLIRGRLLRLADDDHALLLTMHHIVSDGWSLGVLAEELSVLYAAYVSGDVAYDHDPLPPLPVQYADYASWQRRRLDDARLEGHLAYWTTQLADAPSLSALPTDRPRPATQGYVGDMVHARVPETTTAAVGELARRHDGTVFMVLMAAFHVLLSRHTGQNDLNVGTVVANRDHAELEPLIGMLLDTQVIRARIDHAQSFVTLLDQVRETVIQAHRHQELPFDTLLERLRPERHPGATPLFQVMLQMQNMPDRTVELPGLALEVLPAASHSVKFDLTIYVTERDGLMDLAFEYDVALFDRATVERLASRYVLLLDALLAMPAGRLAEVSMLDEAEEEALRVTWNATAMPLAEVHVHERFAEQARRMPDRPALRAGDVVLTYAQLDDRATRLARYLVESGVAPGETVGLYLPRSPALLIAVLGVLKAGGAYVPLEPSLPAERIADMLDDAGTGWVLLESSAMATLPLQGVDVVLMDGAVDDPYWLDDYVDGDLPEVAWDDLAYVMYTSGSTGRPKGVMVEHRSLGNYLAYAVDTYLPGMAGSVVSSPLCFDATLTTLLPPLLTGGQVWLLPDDDGVLPALAERLFADDGDWLFKITPAHLEALSYMERAPDAGHAAHRIVVGGEQLTMATLHRWKGTLLPRAVFVNEYGPTETVVGCSTWTLASADQLESIQGAAAPIGRPIANTTLYVLDAAGKLRPPGCVGELYIGGAGVARGYLGRDELTRERFIANPFGEGRLYRTGDLVRHVDDGVLLFLGRIDEQVKIRGFRIELGEIESLLVTHAGAREAVVLVREDVPGDRRLVAYVVAEAIGTLDPMAMREVLASRLPDYMLPSAWVTLATLPLTTNGKVDRRALPAPSSAGTSDDAFEAPQGRVETLLAAIWRDLLRVERVGRHDHFFQLGGHSLLAVQLMERMRREGLHVDIRALFARPTLAALAKAVSEGSDQGVAVPANGIPAACEAIVPDMLPLVTLAQASIDRIVATVPGGASNVQDIYPLAPLQEGILFHHLLQERGDAYLSTTVLAFDTRERMDAFVAALRQVVDRHDVLRTAVLWDGLPEPVQVVWRHARFDVEELAVSPEEALSALVEYTDSRHFRLDLRQAPLIRGYTARDDQGRVLLQLVHHHLVLDHTALDVLLQEVGLILDGRHAELPEAVPFRNFVAQARLGVGQHEHEAFFRDMLGDVDEPTAPFGQQDVRGDGADVYEAHLPLSMDLARRLRAQARGLGVSAASLFQWAWAQVLARTTGRDDVVFGTVLFGRLQGGAGTDRTMGLLINTLPLRVRLGDSGVRDAVRHAHDALSGLMRHEHASLALAQRCSGLAADAPLFSSILNYRHSEEHEGEAPAWAQGVDVLAVKERTNYPFMMSVDDLGDGFELGAQVSEPIAASRMCEYMRQALERLVDALESAPDTPCWRIDVLGDKERQQLLAGFNDTGREWSDAVTGLHGWFERQARATPDAPALVHLEQTLSYRELDEASNRLGHHLRALGVGTDDRVAIAVRRNASMVIAMLATLKAGGAYVSLDPSYPSERLAYMLEDSRPRVVLAQLDVDMPSLPPETMRVDLDATHRPWELLSKAALPGTVTSRDLAYVIYTSGSTGRPKGVAIDHGNAVNFIGWALDAFSAEALRHTLFSTSLNFDLAVFECFAPLACGGCIHLVDNILALATHDVPVTLVNTVPSALAAIVAEGVVPPSVRVVNVAGEPLRGSLADALFATTDVDSLCNLYGPSETTTYSTWIRMDRRKGFDPSIGRPIANTSIYLLDRRGLPVPMGAVGEIHIGGAGVARGYLDRPSLTDERFLPDAFASAPAARMYRTGDLGRWRPDGTLDYLGRNDHQVKVRGFRIEPGEVEAHLMAIDGVREALVMAREEVPGDRYLAAYLVPSLDTTLDTQHVRKALAATLPPHMLPTAWVVMPSLPLTPNGKVDRKALPVPSGTAAGQGTYEAPAGEVETTLASIWSELLRVERIGRHDRFFDLGGHSLLATQLLSRVRGEWEIDMPLTTVFTRTSLAEFADAIVDFQLSQFDADDLERLVNEERDLLS